MNRNLDGVWFRVKRENTWENVCFSDLTEDEMKSVLAEKSSEWLISLCLSLGKTIKWMGDTFNIEAEAG
jgi:hypothetical protein